MSNEATSPNDEFERAIKKYIAAGAAGGATAAARRLLDAVNLQLDDVTTALQALVTEAPIQAISANGSFSLPAVSTAGSGSVSVTGKTATVTVVAPPGTVKVSAGDLATIIDELDTTHQPDVDRLASRPPAEWSRQELIWAALVVVIAVYIALPSGAQAYLVDMASLLQGIDAVIALLLRR
jgi:hypothetical protein